MVLEDLHLQLCFIKMVVIIMGLLVLVDLRVDLKCFKYLEFLLLAPLRYLCLHFHLQNLNFPIDLQETFPTTSCSNFLLAFDLPSLQAFLALHPREILVRQATAKFKLEHEFIHLVLLVQ